MEENSSYDQDRRVSLLEEKSLYLLSTVLCLANAGTAGMSDFLVLSTDSACAGNSGSLYIGFGQSLSDSGGSVYISSGTSQSGNSG